jgi:hypothetical protein
MGAEKTFQNFEEHKVALHESLDNIAEKAGITWQQLAKFNWGTSHPTEINECLHDLVGSRHKTKDGKNYIFTSDDDPGIISLPVKSPKYNLSTTQTHVIQVHRPHLKCNIEVETVDDFLHVAGGVTVVLKRKEGGPNVEITSDETGYGVARGVLTGHYEVTVKGGGKAYFLKHTNKPDHEEPDGEYGDYEDAVIDTRHFAETLSQLVVKRIATQSQKQERKLLQKVYTRTKSQTAKGRGEETAVGKSSGYTRLQSTVAVDNLALAAGWTDDSVDIAELVGTVLPDFIACRDGAPANRGFYVWVVEAYAKSPRISLYNSSGLAEVSFHLAKKVYGPFGAYSTFQDCGGQLFVDMMTKSYTVTEKGNEGSVILIYDLVSGGDRQKLVDAANGHPGQKPILYFLPTLPQLAWLGLHGGSGRLEDYGNEESVNERIHERNKLVCQRMSYLYNGYIGGNKTGYIGRVKKTKNEKELRALGPPWAPYVMPPPAQSQSTSQSEPSSRLMDLYSSYNFNQLGAWKAIAEQLDKFANRMSEGAPYISLRAKYEVGEEAAKGLSGLAKGFTKIGEPLPLSVEIEGRLTFQFTDDEIRTLAGDEEKAKIAMEGEFKDYPVGIEYKRNVEKPEEWEVTIKAGVFELEANKDGTRKIAIQALPEVWAESQYDPNQAAFEGGLKIETKAILHILKKIPLQNKTLLDFLAKYEKKIVPKEVSVRAGIAGMKQRTVLALITNAPGFFEMRDLDELVRLQWNALTLDEQTHLTNLDWDQCSWDLKSYADAELPKSMEEEWNKFSPQQQISTLHLGFYDGDDYHTRIQKSRTRDGGWKAAIEKTQCTPKEGGEAGAPAGGE